MRWTIFLLTVTIIAAGVAGWAQSEASPNPHVYETPRAIVVGPWALGISAASLLLALAAWWVKFGKLFEKVNSQERIIEDVRVRQLRSVTDEDCREMREAQMEQVRLTVENAVLKAMSKWNSQNPGAGRGGE